MVLELAYFLLGANLVLVSMYDVFRISRPGPFADVAEIVMEGRSGLSLIELKGGSSPARRHGVDFHF